MQIPEAVFHLMRNTNLKSCDLSFNVISKIPPKLGSKFSGITGRTPGRRTTFMPPKTFTVIRSIRKRFLSGRCEL